jgi:microcystin-dependent protein
MSAPFVAEIRIFGFNFPPIGWAACDGQILAISQNTALFSLIGTFYGGDGKSNFALPNLQGSAPLASGNGAGLTPRVVGETGGETSVTLIQSEMPQHTHSMGCSTVASNLQATPTGGVAGQETGRTPPPEYSNATPGTLMNPSAVSVVGGSGAHNNLPPFLVLNFCIALQGIYPPRQ